jgi:hypothetical protein
MRFFVELEPKFGEYIHFNKNSVNEQSNEKYLLRLFNIIII